MSTGDGGGSSPGPDGPPRARPTLEQVAARAGVSRATVSRVVNRSSTVDPRLAERVVRAVEELHYVPNLAARTLMTRRTDTVVLVAAESSSRVFGDPFFSAIVRGASQELSRLGMHLVLSLAHAPADVDRVEAFVRGGHVDGALVISEHDSLDVIPRLAATDLPVVVGGRPLARGLDVASVDHDNRGGAAMAARHLLAVGRERIGTVAGPQDMAAGVDRLEGFREGLGPRFDPDLVEEGDFTTSGGAAATAALVQRRRDLDGLFVASDMMAVGALSALRAAGRRVPDQVAVVGFDDAEVAAATTPPLTTVRQRSAAQGRLMAQVLAARLGREVAEPAPELTTAPDTAGIVLDVELVVRESA